MLLVGLLIIPVLSMMGVVSQSYASQVKTQTAYSIAQTLISEIIDSDYQDLANPVFGPELDENFRIDFDDVDDYHGLVELPPTTKSGAAIPGADKFEVQVTVTFVELDNTSQTSATETGLKRIQVKVQSSSLKHPVSVMALRADNSPRNWIPTSEANFTGKMNLKLQIGTDSVEQHTGITILNQRGGESF